MVLRQTQPAVIAEGKRRARRPRSSPSRIIFFVLGSFVCVGWLYVIFVSDVFSINRIEVRGLRTMDPVDVAKEVFDILDQRATWRPWPSRHAWFVDRDDIKRQLGDRLFAANVSVDKNYFNVLRLLIQERTNKVIFYSHQQYVWLDLQGFVTNELSRQERQQAQNKILGLPSSLPTDIPIMHRDLDELLAPGYQVTDGHGIKNLIKILAEASKLGLGYRELQLDDASSSLLVFTNLQGHKILMDGAEPLGPQVKTYATFMNESKNKVPVTEYVDVRIPGKVFVK